jgi:hypothetical protein
MLTLLTLGRIAAAASLPNSIAPMACTKINPQKLASGLVGINTILAPVAPGTMHCGGAAPVARLCIRVAGATPRPLNKVSIDF